MSGLAGVGAGRFDADTTAVIARLHRAAKTQPVYMATEVMRAQWKAIKAELPDGWKAVHLNEFLTAWDSRVYKPKGIKAHWSFISRGFFNRGRIKIRAKVGEIRLAYVDVKRDPGCYFGIVHLPAHLQDENRYTTDPGKQDEVKAHKQALRTCGRRAQRRMDNHPTRRQCLAGDVNVDLFRVAWRTRLETELNLSGVWAPHNLPAFGDLGARLVTGCWLYGFVGVTGVITRTPKVESELDHKMMEVFDV